MHAIPELQKLHEKYSGKGFTVLGIDPYDKNAEELATFLRKRGVSYPVVLSDHSIPEIYNVSGYPTFYLIDKTGNIIHAQSGFGAGTETIIEEIILKHL